MATNQVQAEPAFQHALGEVARLRRFTGPPAEFWPALVSAMGSLAGAIRGVLVQSDPKQPERLRKLNDWSSNGHADRSTVTFNRVLPELAEGCLKQGSLLQPIEEGATPDLKCFAVGVALVLTKPEERCVVVFLLPGGTEPQATEALLRLKLVADTPLSYLQNFASQQARADVEKFASIFDVMVQVNDQRRYLAATMAFCNGLATRFNCDRVSVGWLETGYIRLKAISRTERFDKNMAAVKALELTMEEALDQDEEILWPAPEGATTITRDHQKFAQDQAVPNLCSLPLRLDQKVVAVLTCERQARPFNQLELQQLRLGCDLAARRLADLKHEDRWFGARLASATKEKLAEYVVGPEHTWAKVLAVVIVLALVGLFFIPFPYRAEGSFILRSENTSFLTTPFNSYIHEVLVRPGDVVKKGQVLLRLNTDDLLLEEASALADQNRYLREAEKARAVNRLAEMRIAQALAEQAKAQLDLTRYRLEQALLKAPFDGVVVEGDLRERVGAPVRQGDSLFRVARTDSLYVEAEVNERDIHEVLKTTTGQIAFVAQPRWSFPIKVVRVEPSAVAKDRQNLFLVRCAVGGKVESWWRPGMSGVAKFNAGRRNMFWIATHRTTDFLRLWLWW